MPDLRDRLGELGERRDAVAATTDRAERRARSGELNAALAAALSGMSDDDVLAVLDPAVPLVLLPVGIETRFTYVDGTADELLVRILPDDVHVQNHEPELTTGELELGRDYWIAVFRAGREPSREAAAWAMLARSLGPARAAWVKAQLTPANAADRPAAPVADDEPLAVEPDLPDLGPPRAGPRLRASIAQAAASRLGSRPARNTAIQ